MIVCLGDSTTAGTPLFKSAVEAPPDGEGDERSQFPYWLRQAHPEWRVLNCGVNGERSDDIARRFDRDVLAHRPKTVVIIAGVNDVYQGLPASHVTGQLEGMYARARAAGIAVVAGTIVPYNTAGSDQNARMHAVNDWILRVAAAMPGVWTVDTRRAVADPHDPDRLAGSPDELHPDIDGYRRMAETLLPAIERAMVDDVI
jgi:lysophospholipase L1-like esterase